MTPARFAARYAQPAPSSPATAHPDVSYTGTPWLTTAEAADLVRCPSRDAVRKWAMRAGIVAVRRGRRLLYSRRDVLAALEAPHTSKDGLR